MPKVKQQKSAKVQSMLHEYASEFTSTPKGEIFCKFCDCLESDKRFMVKAHRRSAKHQRGSFHETESSPTFYNMLYQILSITTFCFISTEQTYRFVV